MSNTEETKQTSTESTDEYVTEAFGHETETSSDDKNQTQPNAKSSGATGGLAMLIAFVALGVASYSAYMNYTMQQSQVAGADSGVVVERSIADIQLQVSQLQDLATAAPKVDDAQLRQEITQATDQQATALKGLETKLDTSLADLRASIGTSSQDWLLAEVEYLIRLGNQRVLMEQDVAGAIALFESADTILRDSEGIAAFDLRQNLANDIASLRNVGRLDVEGLFVKVGALIRNSEKLQQQRLKFVPKEVPDQAPEVATGFSGQLLAMVDKVFMKILSLVDYRREGVLVKPILPAEEEYYLRQNLVMKLQLAQLGLLKSDREVYETSLRDAATWVTGYFDPAHEVTISFIATLEDLASIDISRSMPDVSGSLHSVRKLLSRFHETSERALVAPARTAPVAAEAIATEPAQVGGES